MYKENTENVSTYLSNPDWSATSDTVDLLHVPGEVGKVVSIVIPVNSDEVDRAVRAQAQEILKPGQILVAVSSSRRSERSTTTERSQVLAISISSILWRNARSAPFASVGFIEGKKVAGTAGEAIVRVITPLEV